MTEKDKEMDDTVLHQGHSSRATNESAIMHLELVTDADEEVVVVANIYSCINVCLGLYSLL